MIKMSKIDLDSFQLKTIRLPRNMQRSEIHGHVTSHLNEKYYGSPTGLQSFLNAVQVLYDMANSNDSKAFLFTIVKSKTDGRARELITNDVRNIVQMIFCLIIRK